MKKFAFLLALVAVFAMSAGAFAATAPAQTFDTREFVSKVGTVLTRTDADNNNGAVTVGSTTNLYYVGKDAENPVIAFTITTPPVAGLKSFDADWASPDLGAFLTFKELGTSRYITLSEDSTGIGGKAHFQTAPTITATNRIISADVTYIITGTASDINGMERLIVYALSNDGKGDAPYDHWSAASSDTSLKINPVEVKVGADRNAIFVVSGEVLDNAKVSLDFTLPGTNAVISTDVSAINKRYDVSFDGTAVTLGGVATRDDANLEVKYDKTNWIITVNTKNSDGATKPGVYPIVVVASSDMVIDETFTGGKKNIQPASGDSKLNGVLLAQVDVVVLPPAERAANVVAGELSFAEGKATQSVIIQTDIIDGGVSDDLHSGGINVFLETKTGVKWLKATDFLRVVAKRQAGETTGTYVDIEIPAATLNTWTDADLQLYVTNKPDFVGGMVITKPLAIQVGSGGGGGGDEKPALVPNATATAETISGDVPGVAEIDQASLTANNVNLETLRIHGGQKYVVSYSYDPDKNTVTSVSVKVGPVVPAPAGYKLAVAMRNPAPTGKYQLFPATPDAESYLTVTVPAACFSRGLLEAESMFYATDVYVVEYQEKIEYTGGGSSGGCEMGFGLAAVAGLAALVLRKRSK